MHQPSQIGPYRIERLLGVGSFATVWLGYDAHLDARVAIKVLAENWSHDLRVRERFRDEARLLWRLDHERLVRVHTFGELDDGRPYAVLAWADRGSLRDRLADGPTFTAAEAIALLQEIAAAVAVLHSHQIVHRDLTPGNVLFRSRADDKEQVLVADLGLAKALAAASGLTARAGTPGYMAPEQDDPLAIVDTRTDVYGLGRLGQELLRGIAPKSVPEAVQVVLRTATAHRPEQRYLDATVFREALAEAWAETADAARSIPAAAPIAAAPAMAVDRSSAPAPPARRKRWAVITACTALVLVIVAGLAAAAVDSQAWLRDLPAPTTGMDSSGRLHVALPSGWRATGSGWSGQPSADGGLEPAILISPDPDAWRTDPAVPGAFIGLSQTLAAEYTPAQFIAAQQHAQCAAPTLRTSSAGDIEWQVATFATCHPGKPELVEAAGLAPGRTELVYVQVAPPVGSGPEFVDSLLAGVQVND